MRASSFYLCNIKFLLLIFLIASISISLSVSFPIDKKKFELDWHTFMTEMILSSIKIYFIKITHTLKSNSITKNNAKIHKEHTSCVMRKHLFLTKKETGQSRANKFLFESSS